ARPRARAARRLLAGGGRGGPRDRRRCSPPRGRRRRRRDRGRLMPVVVVVGAQWGDEGKGKVVDIYTERADMVVRYGGGANAGHTLVIDGQKIVTHLVPSGVLHGRGKRCVLGDGMVIDPKTLLEEIDALRQRGLLPDDRDLVVARGAHVILP